jgi:multidrug efflux pump subunit AcrA (membrane-fusion protein)
MSDRVRSLQLPNQKSASRTRGSWFPWFLCILLAVPAGLYGYQYFLGVSSTANATPEPSLNDGIQSEDRASPGNANPAQASSGDVALESKGNIIPVHQIQVSPKVNGMVRYLRVHKPDQSPEDGIPLEEGLRVEKGDILAQLESTDYESDVARCRAALASAQRPLTSRRRRS